MKYPSLLDSKERTNGMLLESKETVMCCLKEVTVILVSDFTSVEVFENFMVCENLKIRSSSFFLFFSSVQMNSLFIEKGLGSKNNKIRLSLESKCPLVP